MGSAQARSGERTWTRCLRLRRQHAKQLLAAQRPAARHSLTQRRQPRLGCHNAPHNNARRFQGHRTHLRNTPTTWIRPSPRDTDNKKAQTTPPCRPPQQQNTGAKTRTTQTSRFSSASALNGEQPWTMALRIHALTWAAQICCFPAKTKPRTSCSLLAEHVPSPKRRPPRAL